MVRASAPRDTDVFVVGGGPAGLAAAIAARRQGLRVVVADRARPPIDKACGEGLMPDSVALLRALGIEIERYESAPFQGIRFLDARHSIAARFPRSRGAGIRRTVLHQALVDRARKLGVVLLWGTRVCRAGEGVVCLEERTVRTRWIVGADGQNSQVRRWAGLSAGRESARRVGLRRHFRLTPWTDCVEVYWSVDAQAYVTPIGGGQICVAVISKRRPSSFHAALERFPALAERLQDAPPAGGWRGSVTVTRRLRSVFRGDTVLIGEASGSADAVTGEGLALCFRQAIALGYALARREPSLYQSAHRSIMREPRWMARALLFLDGNASLRDRVFRALAAKPSLFGRLLSVHVGELPLTRFGVNGVFHLGWQLLTG